MWCLARSLDTLSLSFSSTSDRQGDLSKVSVTLRWRQRAPLTDPVGKWKSYLRQIKDLRLSKPRGESETATGLITLRWQRDAAWLVSERHQSPVGSFGHMICGSIKRSRGRNNGCGNKFYIHQGTNGDKMHLENTIVMLHWLGNILKDWQAGSEIVGFHRQSLEIKNGSYLN